MPDLDPLIRLRRYRIDEKRKALAELYREIEQLQGQRRDMEAEVRHERDLADAAQDVETVILFLRYSEVMKGRFAELDMSIRKAEVRVRILQDEMRELFADLKKIEIVAERREDAEKAEAERKAAQVLDEVALEGFRRRDEDES